MTGRRKAISIGDGKAVMIGDIKDDGTDGPAHRGTLQHLPRGILQLPCGIRMLELGQDRLLELGQDRSTREHFGSSTYILASWTLWPYKDAKATRPGG